MCLQAAWLDIAEASDGALGVREIHFVAPNRARLPGAGEGSFKTLCLLPRQFAERRGGGRSFVGETEIG